MDVQKFSSQFRLEGIDQDRLPVVETPSSIVSEISKEIQKVDHGFQNSGSCDNNNYNHTFHDFENHVKKFRSTGSLQSGYQNPKSKIVRRYSRRTLNILNAHNQLNNDLNIVRNQSDGDMNNRNQLKSDMLNISELSSDTLPILKHLKEEVSHASEGIDNTLKIEPNSPPEEQAISNSLSHVPKDITIMKSVSFDENGILGSDTLA